MAMKQRLIDALLGKEQQSQDAAPIMTYSPEVTDFVNRLGEQPYMQKLLNAPKEERLSLDEYKQGFTQGLNYGIPEIAKAQDELGVRKPQTDEEIALAQDGLFNKPNVVGVGISNAPRQGGIIRDFMGGLRENYNEGFDPRNLEPDNNKSWATRIGEGLGTAMRFADKPIGRFALATGLSALTGGASPLNEGIEAYVGRQNNMTKDRAYRQGLINMGVDEEQVNNIPGIMTDDIYKNLVAAKQAQEMQKYREMYLDTQQKNQEALNNYRMSQFAEDVKQNELDNYYKGQQLAQGWERIKSDKENAGTLNFNNRASLRKEFTSIPAIKNANEIKRQLDNVTSTYNSYKSGKIRANAADQVMVTTLNKILDPTSVVRESEFARTAAGQSLLAKTQGYADKMVRGGGGLTNAEREDLYNTMLQMYEAQQKEAQEYIKAYTELAEMYNINPAEIMPRQYLGGTTSNNATTQVGNYKEGQTATNPTTGAKIIFRGGKWQTL